jgi:hypothetical protein
MSTDDARRQKPVTIKWRGMIGELIIDGQPWGAIEWSDKRQAWCIEDAEGECLRHKAHIRGRSVAKDEAIDLAQAMIRDGRMPTPEEARSFRKEQLRQQRERRAKQPSEMRRRQQREEQDRLYQGEMEAESRDRGELPLYEVLADALDLGDPELWRSNSIARLRGRLIIAVKAAIAGLEYDLARDSAGVNKYERLARAREILRQLAPDQEPFKVTSEQIDAAYLRARKLAGDLSTIVYLIVRSDPRFEGLAGDKSLWDAVRKLLDSDPAGGGR